MKLGCVPWWVSPPVRPPSGGSAAETRRLSPAACAPSEHLSARVGLRHKTGGHGREVFYWELSGLRSSRDVFSKLVIRRLLFSYYNNSWEQRKKSILQTNYSDLCLSFKCLWALPGNGFTGVSLKPTNWACSAMSALSAWRDCLQGGCLRQDVKTKELWEYTASKAIQGSLPTPPVMCFRQSVQLHALHVIMLTQVPNFSQFVFGFVVCRW